MPNQMKADTMGIRHFFFHVSPEHFKEIYRLACENWSFSEIFSLSGITKFV
jgi:hypothetical protein